MSVYEGGCSERSQSFQTLEESNSRRVVLLCSGCYWDVCLRSGGPAAATPAASAPPNLTWMTTKGLFQATEQHRNAHKSAAGLHSGSSKRHFGPFGPTSFSTRTPERSRGELLNLCVVRFIRFDKIFFVLCFWERSPFVKREQDKLLPWHWSWSPWASGAPAKWLTGWKVRKASGSAGGQLQMKPNSPKRYGDCWVRAARSAFSRFTRWAAREQNTCWSLGLTPLTHLNYSLKSSDRFQYGWWRIAHTDRHLPRRPARLFKPLLCPAVIVNAGLPRRRLGNVAEIL